MSNKKRRQPKQPTQPADPLTPEALKAAQAKHFRALESWALNQVATVCGVPILWCLNYDLVQVTNQAYLSHLLPPPLPVEESSQPEETTPEKEVTSGNDPS